MSFFCIQNAYSINDVHSFSQTKGCNREKADFILYINTEVALANFPEIFLHQENNSPLPAPCRPLVEASFSLHQRSLDNSLDAVPV
jgi:hypothetical protein